MKRLFLDTNILIDFIGQRVPFFDAAEALFGLARELKVELFATGLTFANTVYILPSAADPPRVRYPLRSAMTLIIVVPLDQRH